ncbi:MAG: D-alanyl-D-alanine carboxypeptidase family protein [Gammaproteobacteria bacterium]
MVQQEISLWIGLVFATLLCALSGESWAIDQLPTHLPANHVLNPSSPHNSFTPTPPSLDASAYILVDAHSGAILAEKNADKRLPPASLTKIMTMYVTSQALHAGQLHLQDKVHISHKAWRMGGSKMFIKVGDNVSIENLVQGIIVQSGNDACVAIAEHIAGDEEAFTTLMNQQAAKLGMNNSHFTDSTGLPHPDHYTSPRDMAILARAIINDFPEFYRWYSEKEFTYNNITQHNRNRLLWRYQHADGIKTGHTDEAGYCLASSAQQDDMRLIAIVFGAPSDAARTTDSVRLFNYGFRFYETHRLFTKEDVIAQPRVWMAEQNTIPVGLEKPLYLTVPRGQVDKLTTKIYYHNPLQGPIEKGQILGNLVITLDDNILAQKPIIALQANGQANIFSRIMDYLAMKIHQLMHKHGSEKEQGEIIPLKISHMTQPAAVEQSMDDLNRGLLQG